MTNKNKIVLMTGDSRGLGKDMALQLGQKGFDVILTYHSKKDEAAAVVNELKSLGRKAHALQLDVAQIHSFDAFVANVKTALKTTFNSEAIDALVNNVGTGVYAPF